MSERQLFAQFFRQLLDKNAHITVELKNNVRLRGKLTFVDPNLNFHLADVEVEEPEKYVQLISLKNCFVRGSTVRYVHLTPKDVDVELIQEAALKELKK